MKLLIWIRNFRDALIGREFRRTYERNARAADKLDRAVKEMLER